MAAAALKNFITAKALRDDDHNKEKQNSGAQNVQTSADQDETSPRQNEKRFVVHWEDEKGLLEPNEIAIDPERKGLGHTSRALRIEDFNLIKTLGTGTSVGYSLAMDDADWTLPGTFARVWLAQITNPRSKVEEKVFALKVLRKVDGMLAQVLHYYPAKHTLTCDSDPSEASGACAQRA
jgi:protein kinase A